MNADILTKCYLKIRDAREELSAKYKEDDACLKDQMEAIEIKLLEICKETGVDGLKTAHGAVTRVVKERVWAADWDAFKSFVIENDAIDLLEKRIQQTNFKAWRDEHPDVVAPVNVDRKYSIQVRRSNASRQET